MSSSFDCYGNDVLSSNPHRRGDFVHNPESRPVEVCRGLVVEGADTDFVGEVVRTDKVAGQWQVELEGHKGIRRSFPLGCGFQIGGRPMELVRPQVKTPAGRIRTASGSFRVSVRTRTACESRTWVEDEHDAELIAKIWGAGPVLEGVVVEELRGADRFEECLMEFSPLPTRKAGVLADRLVRGSKEQQIAERSSVIPGILILGHPCVDVWQAARPAVLGLREWPEVPRGEDIKVGTLKRLGWLHVDTEDVDLGWMRILEKVMTCKDLEPSLLGRIEELIDFVTEGSVE